MVHVLAFFGFGRLRATRRKTDGVQGISRSSRRHSIKAREGDVSKGIGLGCCELEPA